MLDQIDLRVGFLSILLMISIYLLFYKRREKQQVLQQESQQRKNLDHLALFFYTCTYTTFLRDFPKLHKYAVNNGLSTFLVKFEKNSKNLEVSEVSEVSGVSEVYEVSESEMAVIKEITFIVIEAATHAISAMTRDKSMKLGLDHILYLISIKYYETVVLRSMTEFLIITDDKEFKQTFFEHYVLQFLSETEKNVVG